jgi:hypothetical protein
MATLRIRRVGGAAKRWLSVGSVAARWSLIDGARELATGRTFVKNDDLSIVIGDRHLIARLAGGTAFSAPRNLTVVDETSGETVVDAAYVSGGSPGMHNTIDETWAVKLVTGAEVRWRFRTATEARFIDADGATIVSIGHDPSFDVEANQGTFRTLMRMWGGVIAASDRYIVQVDERAVGGAVTGDDVPILAMLAMWLERTVNVRYHTETIH